MILVNQLSPSPTPFYIKEQCSRYCHDKGCPHFQTNVKEGNRITLFFHAYHENVIQLLKNNPFGVSYKMMNILVFVIFFPFLILSLLYLNIKHSRT